MKLQLVSDLHLTDVEAAGGFKLPRTGADLLVIAGDTTNGLAPALAWAAAQVRHLGIPAVYVLGNHEFYGESWPSAIEQARNQVDADVPLHVLEQSKLVVDDVRILGTTLWTDFKLLGSDKEEKALSATGALIPDYRGTIQRDSGGKLRVRDTQAAHVVARQWLEAELAQPWAGRTVVVTHHGPLRLTANPQFRGYTTAGFVSDLRPLCARYHVDLWISGHTHYNHDVMVDGARFIANQRGYPAESLAGAAFDPALVVKL